MVVVEDVAVAANFAAAVVVSGAGSAEANGLFAPTGKTWHGAPVYENDRKCLLSREPHRSQKTGTTSYGWILGKDRRPLYAVQADALVPPAAGWRRFDGAPPLPEVATSSSVMDGALAAATALKEQGNTLFRAQLYGEAADVWTRALGLEGHLGEDEPVVIALYSNRSEARLRQERWEGALADAQEALRRRPTHDKALLRAAVAARELGRLDLAGEYVRRCLDEHPDCPQAVELAHDLDHRAEEARQAELPQIARAAGAKLQEALRREEQDADLAGLAPEQADQVAESRRGLKAFSGYGDTREKEAAASPATPLSALPYHHMGLPPEQIELMDNFFKDMREQRAQKEKLLREEREGYERVKGQFKARAEEGVAAGRLAPIDDILPSQAPHRTAAARGALEEVREARQPKAAGGVQPLPPPPAQLPAADAAEIDSLFAPPPRRARERWRALGREEAEERMALALQVLEELRALARMRGGEPARLEQAPGEVQCAWRVPPSITGKDVQVKVSQNGAHLKITVRSVVIFDRALLHPVRAGDVVWSVGGGELELTLTKVERNRLWEQLGQPPEVERDAAGEVVPESLPEPLSAHRRLQMFRAMVQGEDGEPQKRYEELDPEGRRLVDTMRRYAHAQATGDSDALALAELDLEEFGKLVV